MDQPLPEGVAVAVEQTQEQRGLVEQAAAEQAAEALAHRLQEPPTQVPAAEVLAHPRPHRRVMALMEVLAL